MKRILCFLILMCVNASAYAISPVADVTLQEAFAYAKANQEEQTETIVRPWTIEEAVQKNPYREEENIIVYTPYLITAVNVIEKNKNGVEVSLGDAQALIKDYDGILVIGAVINAPVILKETEVTIELLQDGKKIRPYHKSFIVGEYIDKKPIVQNLEMQKKLERLEELKAKTAALQEQLEKLRKNEITPSEVRINPEIPKIQSTKKTVQKVCKLQYHFYFDEAEFDYQKSFQINIADSYCGLREFNVVPQYLL